MKPWVELLLTRGFVTKVDAEDLPKLSQINWTAHDNGKKYARTIAKGYLDQKEVKLHRFVLDLDTSDELVDHINGDPLDNRKSNLRVTTFLGNSRNKRVQSNNLLGIKGVGKKGNRWRARIMADGVEHFLGSFLSMEEATRAYDRAAIKYFGEFAVTNFPRSDYA